MLIGCMLEILWELAGNDSILDTLSDHELIAALGLRAEYDGLGLE